MLGFLLYCLGFLVTGSLGAAIAKQQGDPPLIGVLIGLLWPCLLVLFLLFALAEGLAWTGKKMLDSKVDIGNFADGVFETVNSSLGE